MLIYLIVILLFDCLFIAKGQVTVYFYPNFRSNIGIPVNCDLIKNGTKSYVRCDCNFDNKC